MAKLVLTVAVFAALVLYTLSALDHDTTIDCGPEGKPVLNGTACIDKEPVFIP